MKTATPEEMRLFELSAAGNVDAARELSRLTIRLAIYGDTSDRKSYAMTRAAIAQVFAEFGRFKSAPKGYESLFRHWYRRLERLSMAKRVLH